MVLHLILPSEYICYKRFEHLQTNAPGLLSLVSSLSPLVVRFLRVCLQVDSCILFLQSSAPAKTNLISSTCRSRLKHSFSYLQCYTTALRMKPSTMPYGNARCTQSRFSVTHAQVLFRFSLNGIVCFWVVFD